MRIPRVVLAVIASLTPVAALPAQSADASLHTLRWLTGCWAESRPGRLVEEQWMAPRGGTMLGMGRTTHNETTLVEFEHTRIFVLDGRAVYHAEPSGQTPTDFTAASVSDTLVVFENPAHDFPQRVIYRRRGTDSLMARVEGTEKGQTHGVDFPYARVPCG